MSTINVQFADDSEQLVIAYFSSPQDPEIWPNQGQIDTSDARWESYYDSLPEGMRAGLPAPDGQGAEPLSA